MQGHKRIILFILWEVKTGTSRNKTMADKFMNIPHDDTQNYPYLVVETFGHST